MPENIRQEVIAEQLRLQRLQQQRAAATRAAEAGETSNPNGNSLAEINADVLAALPPNIQEEVLAQQRAEQQRIASQNANPDMPVDAADFIHTLPPALRRQVLTDLDDSQVALLPAEIAEEARTLRQEMETRHRQIQERFFNPNDHISRILRHADLRHHMQLAAQGIGSARYTIHTVPHSNYPYRIPFASGGGRSGAGGDLSGAFSALAGSAHTLRSSGGGTGALSAGGRIRGRQLLDNEALSCLLILLFLDEPKLNVARLHRVLRHLCNHLPTRQWVIQSLLAIMERAREIRDRPVSALDSKQRKGSSQLITLPSK